ncbi:hypothetical protein UCD39_00225 [Nitrospirillum sp. BR 11752]|uniref:hypothetical protein n=1 Tax=Nitrospirillum sp. BR 11752 TaxID=3104293 RepID=UPI002EB86030|nr:hypothetical protein [Nitrospirillum sp. BR 11752]
MRRSLLILASVALTGVAVLLSPGAEAQDTGNSTDSPAAGPAAPPALTDEIPRDIIITPRVLPTPEEEKAYHDAEYTRLKVLFGPLELPPPSRGDSLSRDETQNTGTLAGPKAVNCADIAACYAPPK